MMESMITTAIADQNGSRSGLPVSYGTATPAQKPTDDPGDKAREEIDEIGHVYSLLLRL